METKEIVKQITDVVWSNYNDGLIDKELAAVAGGVETYVEEICLNEIDVSDLNEMELEDVKRLAIEGLELDGFGN